MTVSAAGQFEIGTTPTLLMGPTTSYEITRVDGLGSPQIRTSDIDKVGDGVYAARDTLAGRTVSLDVEIWGTPGSDLTGKVAAFLTAFQRANTDVTLTWQLTGLASRYVNGRPRRCAVTWDDTAEAMGFVPGFVDFFCQDPRIFLTADNTVVIF